MAQFDVSLLSGGAIKASMEGQAPPSPRLQILGIKGFTNDSRGGGAQKYRIQVSDGIHCGAGMLATQLNEKITSNEISKYCIVRVDKMLINSIGAKKVMIFIKLTVLYSAQDVGGMLGTPRQLNSDSTDSNSVTPTVKDEPLARPPLAQRSQVGVAPAPVAPQPIQTPPRFYGNSAQRTGGMGGASNLMQSPGGGTKNVVPITALNPYQNKWTIKARVTSKPPLRHYNNSRGEGRILTLEFVDHSGEIRATAFNEDADRFFPNVEVNKVYYVSRGRIKPANKIYYANNDYELTLGAETTIEEVEGKEYMFMYT
ncbi:PREDICTED: replication protein A 70 kDa DNA-binding subunit-like [Amphimedon queenslandica]|uniref:Replication protein A 70 kDa DNA-binding subunit n=1 Tax=Amphimedon queenslandica TaxID=400682 RepID=A0A1X7UIB6_AMPQE|nr:PREDICTED: replication protein A 70 kDa DNA-binding subunit-like [Amphimedon queenslandica]|eukprot:XP_011405065.2 PREDICTED: replication protein A 70 kDa DNA-binding subunit-like [Amphimedon queenslandica]